MKTLEQFDELYDESITQEKFNELIKEETGKQLKHEIVANGHNIRKPDNVIIVRVINELLPVVKLYTNESKEDTNSYELLFYDPMEQIWTMSDTLFKNVIIQITGMLNANDLNNIKLTLKADLRIPAKNISMTNTIHIKDRQFDTFINFKNGRYHIIDNTLESYKPSMVSTNILPYDYTDTLDDEYKDIFDNYFNDLANGNTKRSLLLKQIYLAMLLGVSPKKAINLYGPAGSGKSTYINAGVNLGGGYHNTLYANYSQIGKDDFLTQIKNKKIIAGMDNEDGVKLIKILNILKSLLSHESFSYSVKYESPRTNIFNGVFIQAFNVSPDFRSQGSAQPIIDRMIITKIDNRFRNSENENRRLGEFFNQHNTLSQLAKYLLTTVDAFDDFEEPDKELSENLIEGDDSVKQFFEELELSGVLYAKIISRSHLYIAYKHFCKENEHDYPSGEKSFYNKIEQYLEKYDFRLSVNEQTGLGNRKIKNGLNNEGLHELINLPDHYEGPSKGYYYERPDFTLNHNEQLSLSEICYICADKLVEAKKEKDLLINYTLGKEILEEILEGNQNRELINEKLSEMILD